MSKRLQVILDDEEYEVIRAIARRQGLTLAEWVRRALRRARCDASGSVDSKLRVIDEASRHTFPTADMEVMLREMALGHTPARCARVPFRRDERGRW